MVVGDYRRWTVSLARTQPSQLGSSFAAFKGLQFTRSLWRAVATLAAAVIQRQLKGSKQRAVLLLSLLHAALLRDLVRRQTI